MQRLPITLKRNWTKTNDIYKAELQASYEKNSCKGMQKERKCLIINYAHLMAGISNEQAEVQGAGIPLSAVAAFLSAMINGM